MKTLRNYQVEGVNYLSQRGGCGALFWEMRLGKSLTALTYIKSIRAQRILVVTTYSTIYGWLEEINAESDYHVYFPQGTTPARNFQFELLKNKPGFFFVNKEAHLFFNYLKYDWDAIILDECFINNPSSKITQYLLEHASRIPIRIILTGTPADETEEGYWAIFRFIDKRIMPINFWQFRFKYFKVDQSGYGREITSEGRTLLSGMLKKYCSNLTLKDVNLQNTIISKSFMIQLSKETYKTIKTIEKDAMIGDDILKFAGQRWVNIRQLCSGTEKLKFLKDLMETKFKGKRIVIWAWYVEEVIAISKILNCKCVYGKVGTDARNYFRLQFNRGILNTLVAEPACWKYGTRLENVDVVIFFSLPASLTTYKQTLARCVDVMAEKGSYIVYLTAANTLESDIYQSLQNKENRVQMLDRLRRGICSRR